MKPTRRVTDTIGKSHAYHHGLFGLGGSPSRRGQWPSHGVMGGLGPGPACYQPVPLPE
jgi:hypothetical protein